MEEPEVIVEMVIFWLTLVTRQKTQRIHPLSLRNNNTSRQHQNFSNARQEEVLQASDIVWLWTRGAQKKIPIMQVAWQKLDAEHQCAFQPTFEAPHQAATNSLSSLRHFLCCLTRKVLDFQGW